MNSTRDIHIAILCGGISDEDYLSRRSAQVVEKSLEACGYSSQVIDWAKDGTIRRLDTCGGRLLQQWPSLLACFTEYRPTLVFNALHGEKENAGQLQGFLELVGIPFTGNGIASSVIGMDKVLTKDVFDELSILTPKSCPLGFPGRDSVDNTIHKIRFSQIQYPIMLKLTHGGSSSRLDLIENEGDFFRTWQKWARRTGEKETMAFVEEYIDGPEYCVGIFGHWRRTDTTILPTARIEFEGKFFDKDIKFRDKYRVNCVPDLSPQIQADMQSVAVAVHRHLKFVGFSRMDFRVKCDKAFALEVNTHPGLGASSIVTNMMKCSDLTMEDAVFQLVEWSLFP